MILHQVVNVITVWNRLMSALRSVNVALFMSPTLMTRRTAHRIYSANIDLMLLDAISPQVLQTAVLQIVDVAIVFYGFVSAGGAVDMGDWGFLGLGLVHGVSPLVSVMAEWCFWQRVDSPPVLLDP